MLRHPLAALLLTATALAAMLVLWWSDPPGATTGESAAVAQPAPGSPHVTAPSPEHAGRYLALASGCNDCHTPGWMQVGDTVPEALWLTGVPIGWRGPWGTTYASNLRLAVQPFTEEQWIQMTRKRSGRPPMPWPSLHAMSDQDLRSIYRYIKSLPVTGSAMPDVVPPGREPKGLYVSLMPQGLMPAAAAGEAGASARTKAPQPAAPAKVHRPAGAAPVQPADNATPPAAAAAPIQRAAPSVR